jgi:hypothetical protein
VKSFGKPNADAATLESSAEPAQQAQFAQIIPALVRSTHCPFNTGMLSVFCEAMISQVPFFFSTSQVNIPFRGSPCFT